MARGGSSRRPIVDQTQRQAAAGADYQRKPKNPKICRKKVTRGGSSWAVGVAGFAATAVVVVAVAEVEVEVEVLSDSLSVVDGLLELVDDVCSADSVVRVLVAEDVVVLDVDVLDVDPDSDLLSSPAPKPNNRRRKLTKGFSCGAADARVAGAATLAAAVAVGDSVVVGAVLVGFEVAEVALLDDEADVDELSELSLPDDVVRVLVLSSPLLSS